MQEIEKAITKAGSAYKLAKLCECNESTISRIRRGERMPSLGLLARIENKTGVPMKSVITRAYEEALADEFMRF